MGLFDNVLNGDILVKETNNSIIESGYDYLTESAFPDSIPYLKTMNRSITLPKGEPLGKGNLCFLYTNNTNESLELINKPKNFTNGNHYYYYFYNYLYKGRIHNKNYTFKELEIRRNLYKKLKDNNKNIYPYLKNEVEEKEDRNMYFDLSRYIEIFNDIASKVVPLKRITLYWEYMKSILFTDNTKGYNKRFILIDTDKYPMKEVLSDNLSNPVFILYYTMFRDVSLLKDIDIDYYLFSNKKCLKINPSTADKKTYREFKIQMGKLYSATKKEILNKAVEEKIIKKEEAVEQSIGSVKDVISNNSDNVITDKEEINKDQINNDLEKKIKQKAITVRKEMELAVPDIDKIPQETINNAIQTKVENDIDDDKELLSQIYDSAISTKLPKNTASTERDKLLKKEQENLKIGNMTIKDIEKIKAEKIDIPVTDISSSVNTTNPNMKKLRFINYDKSYNEKLMPKDITDAILSLNKRSIPMYVRKIEVNDTSDELNYRDTYTIYLEDANRQRHTLKIDIPKFIDNKFLYIGGNKKVIKKQNFLYPVVKTNADIVQIVTNYNKMLIQRVGTRSISSIERLKNAIKKSDSFKGSFIFGNALSSNKEHITTIEYDELSRFVVKYKKGKCAIFFDQNEALEYAKTNNIKLLKNHLFVGVDHKGLPIFINNETQLTDDNLSIVSKILESCSKENIDLYSSIKVPKRVMYTRVMVMGNHMSVGLLLGFWEGLSSLLKKAKVNYRLENKVPKELKPNEGILTFNDCCLIYDSNVGSDLLINGFKVIDTSNINIEDMDTQDAYFPYLTKVYGTAVIGNALMNVYECMIDPITEEVLKDINLPTDLVELIIYAVSLLSDSQFTPEINQNLARVRSSEIIPAILYERLSKNYINYRNSNGKKKFSVPQECVIKELLALKTVEDYSTLNPTLELEMTHSISSKGFRGANLDESYTVEKRSYDKSMTGIISPGTAPDGGTGVNKTLSMEPSIKSLRGYVDCDQSRIDKLSDVNLFSPAELSIPLGVSRDDAVRIGHAIKQSRHVIPVKNSSPVLMSNGLEEVCRFQLSSDFVINADEDGEIIDYDEKSNIMIAKYKSGKCKAINLGHSIVKNGGGGFFLSNQLATNLQVGNKFKKNDVLAYHKDFFTNDKFNNCRMNMGTLSKVALMSTYNTYQDATMITEKLSDDAATEMCFLKQVSIGKNANVEYIVKEGQEIKVGDSLVQFDTSYEDNSLNKLLASLSEDETESVLAGSRNDVPSKYSGVIEEIRVYSTVDTDELSPTLRKIVKNYYSEINKKKQFLEKYDPESKDSIVKCGMLLNKPTKKIEPSKFGLIKGQKIEEGVLIEIYIKHSEPLEIGSKIANFTALKNTIGELIPRGYEPYSDFRPDEEVSTIIASNSILKRMTPSILLTALGNKNIIELKRKLKEIYDE